MLTFQKVLYRPRAPHVTEGRRRGCVCNRIFP